MQKESRYWYSPNLSKEMDIMIYGHYGFTILLFPTITDSALENENNGLIEAISPYIEKGKCKVFCVSGVNFESWLNEELPPAEKSIRHLQYNKFITEEVVPFIFGDCGCAVPIITAGAAIGAYHAANTFFRRPDIFFGVIAMSGTYNIEHYTKGYFDDNCYFNSPIHYIPNLTDYYWLSFLMSKHHIYLVSGSGDGEHSNNTLHLGGILKSKEIPHQVNIWGPEWGHNFKTWNTMLPHFLVSKF